MKRDPAPWIVIGIVFVLGMRATRGLFHPVASAPGSPMASNLLAAPSVLAPAPIAYGSSALVRQPSYGTAASLLAAQRTSSTAGRLAAQAGVLQVDIGAAR